MSALSRAVPVVLTLLLACGGGAAAEPVSFPEPTQAVREGGGVAYADLVGLVVPGIGVSGGRYSGGRVIGVREIDGEVAEDLQPESMAALRVAAVPVRSGGMERTALLLDFGRGGDVAGLAVLALFEVADEPRLLDAANVASGTITSFLDPARLPVGAGDDLLATRSTHANSSQGYTTAALILVRNDRLELADWISLFDEKACAYERTQQLDIRQGAGEPFAEIVAVVTERTAPSGEQCSGAAAPEPAARTLTVTYRWDTATQRYLPDSDAFDVLARENEGRF